MSLSHAPLSAPPRTSKALVAITDLERDLFFPGPMWEELESIMPGLQRVAPDCSEDWAALFEEFRPECLVSCWRTTPLPGPVLPSLRYICHLTGSIRNIIPRAYLEAGVRVSNWGGDVSDTVAEHALLLVLSCLRRMTARTLDLHQRGQWREEGRQGTRTLFGRRVGLHGFGHVARHFVRLVRPFGVEIAAYSEGVPDELFARHDVHRCRSLEELFSRSQVVVEMEGLTPETHQSVQERHLRLLPPDSVFVNVGRGELVDEEALLRVAREGRLSVGLDVFAHEPLPVHSPFRGLENVVLTPHIAGPTEDRLTSVGQVALRNLRHYLDGEELENLVTLAAYDRAT